MDLEKLIDQLTRLEKSMSGLLEAPPPPSVEKYQPRADLDTILALPRGTFDAEQIPRLVLQHLSDFFQGGILLQRRAWHGNNAWSISEYICCGQHHTVTPQMQTDLSYLLKGLSPQQIGTIFGRTPAKALIPHLPAPLAVLHEEDTFAYLMVPREDVAYIWFSQTPALWREDQMRHALGLINQAFTP